MLFFFQVMFPVLLPVYVLQRLTIPFAATEEGYSQQWLIAALLCCPLALILYFDFLTVEGILVAMAVAVVVATAGGALTWFDQPGQLPGAGLVEAVAGRAAAVVAVANGVAAAAPGALAVVGFVMGVVWIDTIAGEVVGLLSFAAALANFPAGILGLTLLAWGNSLGDFFGNRAMARKGYASTAITACFAGPLFTLLMSLGLGFSSYLARLGTGRVDVGLTPELALGCFFLIGYNIALLSVGHLCQGRLPKWFALFARCWYGLYFVLACMSGIVELRAN
jgi:sodium/potassium/calcium exchanger 6